MVDSLANIDLHIFKNEAIDETNTSIEVGDDSHLHEMEIVIEIDAKESDKNDSKDSVLTDDDSKPKLASKFVEPKQVVDLTDD